MRPVRRTLAISTLALAPALAADAPDPEIEYLLSAVADSRCVFIRNGKEHTAAEAAEHLQMKYRRAGRRVDSAETFIARIASESSLSGRPYLIDCGGDSTPTREWLTEKLGEHRDAR